MGRCTTSFRLRRALADDGHAPGSIRAFREMAEPVAAVWPVIATGSALRVCPVYAAVIVVAAGLALHHGFKRLMTAVGKLHGISPFVGVCVDCDIYIKNASHREICLTVKRIYTPQIMSSILLKI